MEKALALVVLVTKRDNNESLRLLWKRPLKVFQRCLWEWGAAMDLGGNVEKVQKRLRGYIQNVVRTLYLIRTSRKACYLSVCFNVKVITKTI